MNFIRLEGKYTRFYRLYAWYDDKKVPTLHCEVDLGQRVTWDRISIHAAHPLIAQVAHLYWVMLTSKIKILPRFFLCNLKMR